MRDVEVLGGGDDARRRRAGCRCRAAAARSAGPPASRARARARARARWPGAPRAGSPGAATVSIATTQLKNHASGSADLARPLLPRLGLVQRRGVEEHHVVAARAGAPPRRAGTARRSPRLDPIDRNTRGIALRPSGSPRARVSLDRPGDRVQSPSIGGVSFRTRTRTSSTGELAEQHLRHHPPAARAGSPVPWCTTSTIRAATSP